MGEWDGTARMPVQGELHGTYEARSSEMEERMSDKTNPQGGLTRRGFLKSTVAVAGGAALVGGTATLTALAESETAKTAADKIGYSVCRGNCGSRCPMKVEVRGGKVVRTSAAELEEQDNADHRRICVKGLSQP